MNEDMENYVANLRTENTRLREMLRECAETLGELRKRARQGGIFDIRARAIQERIEQVLKGQR